MRPGVLSPFNAIVDSQRAASALVYSETQAPHTTISADGTYISYRGITIEVERWIVGMHECILDTHRKLVALCRGQDILVDIPTHVPDDMTRTDRHYSWLNNASMLETPHPLLRVLMEDPVLKLCSVGSDGNLVWNIVSARLILQDCADILSGILVANQVCAGQPSRITELMDSSIRNGNRPRTFFRQHGDLLLVTRRLKTQNLTHEESFLCKKVPRGPFGECPRGLAEINEFYYLVVRPVEEVLGRVVAGDKAALAYHEYMYVRMGSRVTEDQFSSLFRLTMSRFCGVDDMSPRVYRQIVVAIAREYLGSEFEIQEDEDDALALQQGHDPATRRLYYANDTTLLPSLTSDALLRFCRMSDGWARLLRLFPGAPSLLPLRLRRRIVRESADAGVNLPGAPLNLEAMTAFLSTTIASSISQLKVNLELQIQRAVAAGFAETITRGITKRKRAVSDPSSPHLLPLSYSPVRDHSASDPTPSDPSFDSRIQLGLRLLFPDVESPSFRSPAQRLMVEASLRNYAHYIAVLPTGGGKSTAYLMPALLETSGISSVVMIPNKALLQDSLRKTIDLNIRAKVWSTQDPHEAESQIVFVAVESIVSDTFQRCVLFVFFFRLFVMC